MAHLETKAVTPDNNPHKLDLDRPMETPFHEDGTVEGAAASELELNKSAFHSNLRLELGVNLDIGTMDGGTAVGGGAEISIRSGRMERSGDISLRLGLGFGAYSITRHARFSNDSIYSDDYVENCEPWDPYCGDETYNESNAELQSNESYTVEYSELNLRAQIVPALDVGIARLGPGLLAFEFIPYWGLSFMDLEAGEEAGVGMFLHLYSGLSYLMDCNVEIAAGVKLDLHSIIDQAEGAEGMDGIGGNTLASIRAAYSF